MATAAAPIRLPQNHVDFAVAEAVDKVKTGPGKEDLFPIHGSSSALQKTLVAGIRWSHGSGAAALGAHTIIPVASAAASALDAVVHAFAAVLKTAVFIPRSIVWIATAGTQDIAEGANLADAAAHAAKAVGSVGMIFFAPAISLFSSKAALSFADSLHITGGLTKIDLGVKKESLMDGVRAQKGIFKKAAFLGKEIFNRGVAAPVKGTWKHTFGDRPGTTTTVLGLLGLSGAAYYTGTEKLTAKAQDICSQFFNADNSKLTEEIKGLKGQVTDLTGELATANGSLGTCNTEKGLLDQAIGLLTTERDTAVTGLGTCTTEKGTLQGLYDAMVKHAAEAGDESEVTLEG